MRIIFLDIDGVLNNQLFYCNKYQDIRHAEAEKLGLPYACGDIDETSVEYLNYLVESSGAKIVITSSWRGSGIDYCRTILDAKGLIKDSIIDITPHLHYPGSCRGNEIKAWIEKNINLICESPCSSDYKDYVILDDDSDMLYEQRNNFILVDGYCGLTPNQCYRAQFILDVNLTYSKYVDNNRKNRHIITC